LADDVRDYQTRLGDEEKRATEILLGFFNPMESLVTHNLVFSIYRHVTAPEARLYLARQIWEEEVLVLAGRLSIASKAVVMRT
jgi:ribonucleoside-diphosphate reductase beta chain